MSMKSNSQVETEPTNTSWRSLHDGEPPLYLERMCTTTDEVQGTFDDVLVYMLSRAEEDQQEHVTQLFLFINATNGYVQFSVLNEQDEYAGDWLYTLQLTGLWEASLEHDDGAFFFDNTCAAAASLLAEESHNLPSTMSVSYRTEFAGPFDA